MGSGRRDRDQRHPSCRGHRCPAALGGKHLYLRHLQLAARRTRTMRSGRPADAGSRAARPRAADSTVGFNVAAQVSAWPKPMRPARFASWRTNCTECLKHNDITPADQILGHGMLGEALWRLGEKHAALEEAQRTSTVIAESNQISHFVLPAYSAIFTIYAGLWAEETDPAKASRFGKTAERGSAVVVGIRRDVSRRPRSARIARRAIPPTAGPMEQSRQMLEQSLAGGEKIPHALRGRPVAPGTRKAPSRKRSQAISALPGGPRTLSTNRCGLLSNARRISLDLSVTSAPVEK